MSQSNSGNIVQALERVKKISKNTHIIQSEHLSRPDREMLVATGWLQEIIRGWYMLVRPDNATRDSAAWYANFWDFTRLYLKHRFGEDYCLSAEASLNLHVENPTIPQQLVIIVKQGSGLRTLMHNTSLMIYADPQNFPEEIIEVNGLRVMSLGFALCKITPSYFKNNPREVELALRSVKSVDEISRLLIQYNLKVAASRIMGAYEFLQDSEKAKRIQKNINLAGMLIQPINPFDHKIPFLLQKTFTSPYAGRISAMWAQARESVIDNFPLPRGLPTEPEKYLKEVEELYQLDAYNSLSIEGYQVTEELIIQVKIMQWNPQKSYADNDIRNALAAKGYYDAFQEVKNIIAQVIQGASAAELVRNNLQQWYQSLFGTSVKAGIISGESLLGYRNDRVFIRNSRHFPPPKETVLDAMEAFFDCLKQESHPGVSAVLGHYFFVFIHPYMDGNGRLARFIMNTFLASGGYPWTIIRAMNRQKYINTLEATHNHFDMTNFTKFISEEMSKTPI